MRPRVRADGRVITGTPAYSTSLPVVPESAQNVSIVIMTLIA